MQDVYQDFASKLSSEILCEWNLELLGYRFDLDNIGTYRQHLDPMQIVSNTGYRQRVHYEARLQKASHMKWKNILIGLIIVNCLL